MINGYLNQIKSLSKTADKSRVWLVDHQDINRELDTVLIGFNEFPSAIPIFGGSGDKYTNIHPWHHIFFEAEQDLDSSMLLLLMGFYKDSYRSLRSFIELYIFALYHFISEDEKLFEDWLHGKTGTPKIKFLLETISEKSESIEILNQKFGWSVEVESLYRELSGFMHTRGALHTHTALRNSNLTSFSEFGLKSGVEFFIKAIRLVGMGFTVTFPMSFQALPLFDKFAFNQPAGGFLEEDQVERIRSVFSNEISVELSEICSANEEASSLADRIRSMPDLSDEEVFTSLKHTLETDEFKDKKHKVLKMIEANKINEAFTFVQAMQRAMMRTITMVLFNPFYEEIAKRDDSSVGNQSSKESK